MTDSKGSRAEAGWIFFDGECPFCTRLARRFRGVLQSRGFGLARLQDPRARVLLALPADQLLLEMQLCTAEGKRLGGADAWVYLAGEIWWAWPVRALAQLPGMRSLLRTGYRALAARRSCTSGACHRLESANEPRQSLEEGGHSR